MKNYVKLNNNDNQLSLGNLCRIIKENSVNKAFACQTDIFCAIFNIDNISDSTVNNYCIGYRSIGSDYKSIYKRFKLTNYENFETIVTSLISILEGRIHTFENINTLKKYLKKSPQIKRLSLDLYNLSKNDETVPRTFPEDIYKLIQTEDYYSFFKEVLTYIVLNKLQPIYSNDTRHELIETLLNNTNISINELEKILKLQFQDGINYTHSLNKLAKEGNPYACFELGEMEYKGLMTGKPRYIESYKLLKIAALKKHPRANWLIAKMFFENKLGSGTQKDYEEGYNYLKEAEKLGSIAAINTLGLCYLNGKIGKKDEEKAIEYFIKATKKEYVYAYNNLGKIYEKKNDNKKAFEYYLKSANLGESWACNKVGKYYLNGILEDVNKEKAYHYFKQALNVPIELLNPWALYNLAVYFYISGCYEIGLDKNEEKAIKYLKRASKQGVYKALEKLIYIYLENPKENLKEIKKTLNKLSKTKYYEICKKDLEEKLNEVNLVTVTSKII